MIQFFRNLFNKIFINHFSYATYINVRSSAISGGATIILIFYIWPFFGMHVETKFINLMKILFILLAIKALFVFGFFSKFNLPAFSKNARIINKYVVFESSLKIVSGLSNSQYKQLFHALNKMPRSIFFNCLSDIALAIPIVIIYQVWFGHHLMILFWAFIFGALSIAIYAGVAFLLAEFGTGVMRQQCRETLNQRKITYIDKITYSIRYKQAILLSLFVISLFFTNTLTYFNRNDLITVFTLSIIIVGGIVALFSIVFGMILDSIRGAERTVNDLKEGKTTLLFSKSLDREFVSLASGINNAAKTINDYRNNLEQMVTDRTSEIEHKNTALEKALASSDEKDNIMKQELLFAAEVQRGILQDNLNSWNGLSFSATYLPLGQVSGDYYDIIRKKDRVYITIADVSGHGVPAALITMAAKDTFTDACDKFENMAEVCNFANEKLLKKIKTQDYLTAFLFTIDEENNASYVNAGHQQAIYFNLEKQKVELLDSDGFFIGALDEATGSYKEKKIKLQPGDRIFLYTDGITEALNKQRKAFGLDTLIDIIENSQDDNLEMVHSKIIAALFSFIDREKIQDDITILSFELSARYDEFHKNYTGGLLCLDHKDVLQAKKHFSNAYNALDSHPGIIFQLANVNFQLENYTEAHKFILIYLNRYTATQPLLQLAVETCTKLSFFEEAQQYQERLQLIDNS